MGLIQVFLSMFITYYVFYFLTLINKKNRATIIIRNNKLDSLRETSVKTLDEQKKFLDLKYPKNRFKFKTKKMPKILFGFFCYIMIYLTIYHLINLIPYEMQWWQLIFIIIVFPLIINYILKKFNLEKNSLLDLFWRK